MSFLLLILMLITMGALFVGIGISLILSLYARYEYEIFEHERTQSLRNEHA